MISYSKNNLWGSDCGIFVIPADCCGARDRGKCLINELRIKKPTIFKSYFIDCTKGIITPGSLTEYHDDLSNTYLIFATYDHYKSPSHLDWILNGLIELEKFCKKSSYRRKIGIGYFKPFNLNWAELKSYIELVLRNCDDDIVVFE